MLYMVAKDIFSLIFSLIILASSLIVKWNVVSLLNSTSQILSLCLVGLKPDNLNKSSIKGV